MIIGVRDGKPVYAPKTWQWAMAGARGTNARARVYGQRASNGRWFYYFAAASRA